MTTFAVQASTQGFSAYGDITNTTLRPFEFYCTSASGWLSFDAEL